MLVWMMRQTKQLWRGWSKVCKMTGTMHFGGLKAQTLQVSVVLVIST